MDKAVYELTCRAVERDEIDKLLLGLPPYGYVPKHSSSATSTDLTVILSNGLYVFAREHPEENLSTRLQGVLSKLVRAYEGIPVVASIILSETVAQSRDQTPFDIDLKSLAQALREAIDVHREVLRQDRTGEGWSWTDGRLGDLRNLSKNTVRLGGPSFCD